MFYIIATRLPLVYTDTSNRKYLKLFILGSIIYLCVHYYLFMGVLVNCSLQNPEIF